MTGIPDASMLTVAEVARAARVSKMTVYRLIHSGDLDAVRVGHRTLRIPARAAQDLLSGGIPAHSQLGNEGMQDG